MINRMNGVNKVTISIRQMTHLFFSLGTFKIRLQSWRSMIVFLRWNSKCWTYFSASQKQKSSQSKTSPSHKTQTLKKRSGAGANPAAAVGGDNRFIMKKRLFWNIREIPSGVNVIKPEAGFLNESSRSAPALGVTRFIIVTNMIWVTLKSDLDVQQPASFFLFVNDVTK